MHWDDHYLVVPAVTEGPGLVYLLADGLVTALSSAEQLWHVTADLKGLNFNSACIETEHHDPVLL